MSKHDPWRRRDVNRMTAAERAITEALCLVEAVGCDPRLTEAGILLGKARDRVADFVDGVDDRATDPAPELPPDSHPTLAETPTSKSRPAMKAVKP